MTTVREKLCASFHWLNWTQFLGALNDNLFKLLVIFLLDRTMGEGRRTEIVTVAQAVFVVPFLLFSHASGVVADRYSKRSIIVFSKWLELAIMLAGCAAVWTGNAVALYGILFLMCTQSAIFSPAKYGVVPEIVPGEKLSQANGILTAWTYLAIILGTFFPSFLLKKVLSESFLRLGIICVAVAVAGVVASHRMEKTPAVGGKGRFSVWFFADVFRTLFSLRSDRYLLLAVLGSAYFLFLGGFISSAALLYGGTCLKMDWIESGYLFPVAALGIGVGGVLAGKVSGRNIEFGIVPIGAIGLAVSSVAMAVIPARWVPVSVVLFFLGAFSGLFTVPLNAFIQYQSPKNRIGEILACTNFFSFLGVVLSAGLLYLLNAVMGIGPAGCFLVIGVLTGVLAVATLVVLPDFLVRFLIILVVRLCYRIRVAGAENIPVQGPALLVSNHVTWVDALLIGSTQQRRVRFVMSREIYGNRWLNPLFRLMRVIPISADDPPRRVVESLHEARRALDDGYLVCIFAEGRITRNGNLQAFRPGFERILKGTAHPVIPVYIGGAWGSIYSYRYGALLSRFPERIPYPVTVVFGKPMPAASTASQVELAVSEISGLAFDAQKSPRRTLGAEFVRTARRDWFRTAVSDTTGKRLTFGRLLTASIALSEEVDRLAPGQEKVGIVLPASVAGVIANAAVTLTGRVAVNLNFTASAEAVESAVRRSGIRTVLTSRAFLEKLEGFRPPDGCVFLEDLMPRISAGTKFRALMKALFAPMRWLSTHRRPGPDDVATVIFSSGSTGEPKGVMLSHHNILSNIESFGMVICFVRGDCICGILPFFHSFGFTCTLWCPLVTGASACYHANPLDGAKVAEAIRENKATLLMATPTFLLAYIRKAKREDLASLRTLITGAEKLRPKVADAFEERFGFRPMEGYGTTELSPVAAVNLADVTVGKIRHVGAKEGSVGHPIPGTAVKLADPETGADVPRDGRGVLLVKGPNVMLGYLGQPDKTAEVLRDGWYNTGDIARIDEDGFIFILDRLSRYSKIGGEMVPHLAIEEKYQHALGALGHAVAVTSAPDENRGEQLVVLYTDEAGDPERLRGAIAASDLPNLWRPKKENYARVDSIPVLGSGKVDLKRLRDLAKRFVEERKD